MVRRPNEVIAKLRYAIEKDAEWDAVHHVRTRGDARFAHRAWVAGLPSIAARHYQAVSERKQRALTLEEARAHVDAFWK